MLEPQDRIRFEQLVLPHLDSAANLARWLLRNRADSDDVHGETTPSATGVEVIGDATEDYAIAVMVEGHGQALWFAENLLEVVDHQPGTTMRIGGRLIVRDEHGEWHEVKPN